MDICRDLKAQMEDPNRRGLQFYIYVMYIYIYSISTLQFFVLARLGACRPEYVALFLGRIISYNLM